MGRSSGQYFSGKRRALRGRLSRIYQEPCDGGPPTRIATREGLRVMEKLLRDTLPAGRFKGVDPVRSRTMASIRGVGNRSTELRLRLSLVSKGVRGWTLHPAGIQGNPDFAFVRERLIVFVDGCFWHGCPRCGHLPRRRRRFWEMKIRRNRERDSATVRRMRTQGWRVVRFWEHEIAGSLATVVDHIKGLAAEADRGANGGLNQGMLAEDRGRYLSRRRRIKTAGRGTGATRPREPEASSK